MGVMQHPRHWLPDILVDGRCLMVLTDGVSGREISLRAWVRVAADPADDEKARNDEPVRFSVTDFSEDAWLCVLDPHATSRRVYCAPMGGSGEAIRLFKGNSVWHASPDLRFWAARGVNGWGGDAETLNVLPHKKSPGSAGAAAADIATKIGNHTFRATGITAYLKNGGTLEKAAAITTQLYDRRGDETSLDDVELVVI